MKQLAQAALQYTQDNDECWPCFNNQGVGNNARPYGWAGKMYPYIKSTGVFQCPDDPSTATKPKYVVSYAMNFNLVASDSQPTQITRMTAPASTVVYCEIQAPDSTVDVTSATESGSQCLTGGDKGGAGYLWTSGGHNYYETGGMGQPARTLWIDPKNPNGLHTNMSNFAFSDGHVKAIVPQLVSPGATPKDTATGASNCDQDACAPSSYGNAAGVGFLGSSSKGFIATFSPL